MVGAFAYALHDRNPESKLGALANYIQSEKGRGIWICAARPTWRNCTRFGFRVATGGGHGYRR